MPHADIDERREYARIYARRRREDPLKRAKEREASKRWRRAHPDAHKESWRRSGLVQRLKRFGLTREQYDALIAAQGNRCAICGKVPSKRMLNLDHDHDTGEVRGFLCSGCNGASLGRLADDVSRAEARALWHEQRAAKLRAVIEYLKNPPARRVI